MHTPSTRPCQLKTAICFFPPSPPPRVVSAYRAGTDYRSGPAARLDARCDAKTYALTEIFLRLYDCYGEVLARTGGTGPAARIELLLEDAAAGGETWQGALGMRQHRQSKHCECARGPAW